MSRKELKYTYSSVKSPCKGCCDRYVGCHGSCVGYKAYHDELNRIRAKEFEFNKLENKIAYTEFNGNYMFSLNDIKEKEYFYYLDIK